MAMTEAWAVVATHARDGPVSPVCHLVRVGLVGCSHLFRDATHSQRTGTTLAALLPFTHPSNHVITMM